MWLRDKLNVNRTVADDSQGGTPHNQNSYNGKGGKNNDYCHRFNKGKCNLGKACRYEHRCNYCNKFGHGVIVCRKLTFDKEKEKGNSTVHRGSNKSTNN